MEQNSSREVVVYGAGGHGKVVSDVVLASGRILRGFIDDAAPKGTIVVGHPVLGNNGWLQDEPQSVVALGIGDNVTRRELAELLMSIGYTLGAFIHPQAWVSPSVSLGPGTVVMAGAIVNADAHLGKGVIVNSGAIVEHDCFIDDYAHIGPGSVLGGGVRVGREALIGAGSAVRPRCRIGHSALIGIQAAVVDQVSEGARVMGVPARVRTDVLASASTIV